MARALHAFAVMNEKENDPEVEAVEELPDRDAMSLIDPASLMGNITGDPTAPGGIVNSPPRGAAIPGIGDLGISGLPQPPSIPSS